MNKKIILAADQGSSSSKAAAVSLRGEILSSAKVPLNFNSSLEYDPQEILDTQLSAINQILDGASYDVQCIAVAAQRSTIILWDKNTGQVLCPALSWLDGRAAEEAQTAPITQEEIHKKTGLYKTPYYSAPKLQWCIKNYPAAADALKEGRLLAGPVSSFLIWHMTGGKVFASDPTTAQRTLLFNVQTMNWDEDILKAFAIPTSILPRIKPTYGDYGAYKNIPIKVCIGDQQAAACAGGVLKKGDCCLNYGTGAFLMLNIGQKPAEINGILTSLSWNAAHKKPDYLLEGPVNAAGAFFTWLKATGMDFELKDLDAIIGQSKEAVMVLPALGGLGAPYWNFKLTPVFAGLKPATRKPDIINGALRGLCYLLADIAFYIRKSGFNIERLQASGGLVSRALLQTQCDILQTPLLLAKTAESTVLGAAYIAALNECRDAAGWDIFKNYETFKPLVSPAEAERLYTIWRNFFKWAVKQDFRGNT